VIVKLDLKRFTVASIIGRGARFFAEAIVIMVWGEQLLQFLLEYFEIITLIIGAGIIGIAIMVRKMRKKSLRSEL
jgi:membrane protein DedA with SNARE-associated domain